MGRSQPTPAAQTQLDALRAQGVSVTVVQADVTDRTQVELLLTQIDPAYPLRGIVHAAGVLDDGALLQQNWERFARVLPAKVQGTWHLHEATKHLPLDFFVLFSSVASLLGNRGQANYAAANAFLDAFAHYRHTQGLPALSINWGGWSEVGLAAHQVAQTQQQMRERGEGSISPGQGVAVFGDLLSQTTAQVGVLPLTWSRYLQQWTVNKPFYQHVGAPSIAKLNEKTPTTLTLRQQLLPLPTKERLETLTQAIRIEVAHTIGAFSAAPIPVEQPLSELGVDSLMALEIKNRLAASLNVMLHATVIFDYPTVNQLATYLLDTYFADIDPVLSCGYFLPRGG